MTQQLATVKLRAFFAPESSVCILIRRGPSKLSMLIRWDTITDEFQTGQWFRGRVDYAKLSFDGKYMAMGIMGARNTGQEGDWSQHHIVCRPPYAVPLVRVIQGMCCRRIKFGSTFTIYGLDEYAKEQGLIERLAPGRSPFFETDEDYAESEDEPWLQWEGSQRAKDQQGREVLLGDGCVYARTTGDWELLFDATKLTREKIDIPDWARDW